MRRSDIEDQVHEFIVTNFLFGQPLDLEPGDSLLDKGIIDSTGVLELVAFLEERYAIKIEDDELIPDNLDSVTNVTSYLTRKLSYVA